MANEFNPRAKVDQDPKDYMGYSRGFKSSNEAVGSAIGAIGGVVEDKIRLTDAVFKERVNEEVRGAVEEADTRYIGTTPNTPGTLPDDALRQIDRLGKMKKAAEQGKISSEHYYARLNAKAKDIRNRFSGYADEIDNAFKSLIGTTPANALRREVQAAEDAGRRAAAAAANRDAAILDYGLKQGLLPPGMIAKASLPGAANDPVFVAEARLAIGKEAYRKEEISNRIQVLTAQSKEKDFNKERVADTYGNAVFGDLNHTLTVLPEYNQLVAAQKRAIQEASTGGTKKETRDQIIALTSQLRQRGQEIINRHSTAFRGLLGFIPDEKKKIDEMVFASIERISDNASTGAFSALEADKFMAEQNSNADYNNMLANNESVVKMLSLKRALGEQGFAALNLNQPNIISPIIERVTSASAADLARGQTSSMMQELQNQAARGELTAESSAETYRKVKGILESPDADYQSFRNVATAMFGKDNVRYLESLDAEAQKKVFYELSSPTVAKNVLKNGASNPQMVQDYLGFIQRGQVAVGRKAMDTIQSINQGTFSSNVRVAYNEKTNRFSVQAVDPTKTQLLDTILGKNASAEEAVNTLNNIAISAEQLSRNGLGDTATIMSPILSLTGNVPKDTIQGGEGATTLGGGAGAEFSAADNDQLRSFLTQDFGLSTDNADNLISFVDTITGLPSFAEAVMKGDKTAIAAALAGTVIPFAPKGVAGKVAGKVADKAADVINISEKAAEKYVDDLIDTAQTAIDNLQSRATGFLEAVDVDKAVLTQAQRLAPDEQDFKNVDKWIKGYGQTQRRLNKLLSKSPFDPDQKTIQMQIKMEQDTLDAYEKYINEALDKAETLVKTKPGVVSEQDKVSGVNKIKSLRKKPKLSVVDKDE